jgi:hypothetical protein
MSVQENGEATLISYTADNGFFQGETETFFPDAFLPRSDATYPLECPRCRSAMNVIAVITDPEEVRKILRHLVKIGRPPPGLDPSFA